MRKINLIILSFLLTISFSMNVFAEEDTQNDGLLQQYTGESEETEWTEDSYEEESEELETIEAETYSNDSEIIPVEGVQLNESSLTFNIIGQTSQLHVTIIPSDATYQSVTWLSSDPSVATVDDTGIVTAVAEGTTDVQVVSEDGGHQSNCTVIVSLYNGFHQDPDGTDWYYYTNGTVDTSMTGVINGTVNGESGWWYVVKGKVTRTETVVQNGNEWWYINSNGMADFSYNGFAQNSYGWWYLESGKVTFKQNNVIQDTNKKINGTNSWWYVVGSKVQSGYTGVADYKNANGWWYINNGKVDFSANTVAQNKNGWWYVLGGKVQFNYTGLSDYANSYGWWYIKNGKVDFSVSTVAQNKSGWWYVKGGKVNLSYNGFAKNSNGWWYIENGKVTFKKNDVVKGTVNGTSGWWYVEKSKVKTSYTGVADYANSYGWWYIKNGKVDFSANTVAQNKSGWWYVNNGKVNFSYNGIASNENGTWYIAKGKVDFSYTGTVKVSGVTYDVVKGKVSNFADSKMLKKAQSTSSSTKWLIMVDTSSCKLGVFQGSKGNWKTVKYWDCTTGKTSTPTKKGTFKIQSKGKSFGTSSYTCWYYSQFSGNYLIHSVLYKPGSMTNVKDGRLGRHLSHGCVRLALENAKWVYNNIPKGTTVVTY